MDLVNDDSDPEAVVEALVRLQDLCERERGMVTWHAVVSCGTTYRILHGLESWSESAVLYADETAYADLLLPVPSPFPEDCVERLCGYPIEGYYDDLDEVGELFNAALPEVDRILRDRSGRGIMGSFCGEARTRVTFPYEGRSVPVPYDGGLVMSATYPQPTDGLRDFLRAMYRYCGKLVISRRHGDKGPSVSKLFDDGLRRAVDRAYNGGDIAEPVYPVKTGPGVVRTIGGVPDGVPCVHSTGDEYCRFDSKTVRDTERYVDMEPEGPCPYVPSGRRFPDYRNLSPEGLRFYLYWRSRAREGVYGETDEGYVWLYVCELINHGYDDGYVMRELAGLAHAYDRMPGSDRGFLSADHSPSAAYAEYGGVRGLGFEDPSVRPCIPTAAYMIDALLHGRPVRPDPACFILAGDVEDEVAKAYFDRDCAEVAASVLRAASAELARAGSDPRTMYSVREKTAKYSLLDGFAYHRFPGGRRKMLPATYVDYFSRPAFRKEIAGLVKAVAKARSRPLEGKRVQLTLFGLDMTDVLMSEVRRVALGPRERRVSLDEGLLDEAERDLRAVTEMMSVEDPPEPEPEAHVRPPEPAPASSGDPWADLVSRLDEKGLSYLVAALDGGAPADVRREAAVNEAAMDSVGDTVLEDGRVVPEYEGDLRSALGRLTPS